MTRRNAGQGKTCPIQVPRNVKSCEIQRSERYEMPRNANSGLKHLSTWLLAEYVRVNRLRGKTVFVCDHCKKTISGAEAASMNPLTGEPLCAACAHLETYRFKFIHSTDGRDLWISASRHGESWFPAWFVRFGANQGKYHYMIECSAPTWWDAIERAQNAIVRAGLANLIDETFGRLYERPGRSA